MDVQIWMGTKELGGMILILLLNKRIGLRCVPCLAKSSDLTIEGKYEGGSEKTFIHWEKYENEVFKRKLIDHSTCRHF